RVWLDLGFVIIRHMSRLGGITDGVFVGVRLGQRLGIELFLRLWLLRDHEQGAAEQPSQSGDTRQAAHGKSSGALNDGLTFRGRAAGRSPIPIQKRFSRKGSASSPLVPTHCAGASGRFRVSFSHLFAPGTLAFGILLSVRPTLPPSPP